MPPKRGGKRKQDSRLDQPASKRQRTVLAQQQNTSNNCDIGKGQPVLLDNTSPLLVQDGGLLEVQEVVVQADIPASASAPTNLVFGLGGDTNESLTEPKKKGTRGRKKNAGPSRGRAKKAEPSERSNLKVEGDSEYKHSCDYGINDSGDDTDKRKAKSSALKGRIVGPKYIPETPTCSSRFEARFMQGRFKTMIVAWGEDNARVAERKLMHNRLYSIPRKAFSSKKIDLQHYSIPYPRQVILKNPSMAKELPDDPTESPIKFCSGQHMKNFLQEVNIRATVLKREEGSEFYRNIRGNTNFVIVHNSEEDAILERLCGTDNILEIFHLKRDMDAKFPGCFLTKTGTVMYTYDN